MTNILQNDVLMIERREQRKLGNHSKNLKRVLFGIQTGTIGAIINSFVNSVILYLTIFNILWYIP